MTTAYTELKAMTRGVYDLQKLRMQVGLRCVANFRAKLKVHESDVTPELDEEEAEAEKKGELGAKALKVIDELRKSYRRLTDGVVAKKRHLPAKEGFVGDEIISSYSELVLFRQYAELEAEEAIQFRMLEGLLQEVPVYRSWLQHQIGIGPAMAAVLLTSLDPHKARHVSSFWKFAGLDVGPDGRGRSRQEAHLVEREYINKAGKVATRRGITYDPWLKTKLTGVLAGSFLRSGSSWRRVYDAYKTRLMTDPARIKITVGEWKKLYKQMTDGDTSIDITRYWTPGRIDKASKRYMIKMFLAAFWNEWRLSEGLDVTKTYHEDKQGHVHGGFPSRTTAPWTGHPTP